MRDLKATDQNKVTLEDKVSGTEIVLVYRNPTSSEMRGYRQAAVKRKGNKVIVQSFDPALKYGLLILTGFGEGSFGYDGQPISSDPESPLYRADWKDLLSQTASDIVSMLGHMVFDGVQARGAEDEIEFTEAEEILPLATS